MRNNVLFFLAIAVLVCGLGLSLYAKPNAGKPSGRALPEDRIDLKTETLVGKKLDRVVDGPKGKEYHYIYRVQAKPTEKDLPRYTVNPQYGITHTKKGFKPDDSITLISDNPETDTDSPIWVYDVTYVGSGERSVTFQTTGAVMALSFAAASSETGGGSGGGGPPPNPPTPPPSGTPPCQMCGSTPCNCSATNNAGGGPPPSGSPPPPGGPPPCKQCPCP